MMMQFLQLVTKSSSSNSIHHLLFGRTPLAVICVIYQAWLDALQKRNDKSNDHHLPLDHSLRNPSVAVDVVEFLLQQWPKSIQLHSSMYDKEVALHHACQNGVLLPVIELLIHQWPAAKHSISRPIWEHHCITLVITLM